MRKLLIAPALIALLAGCQPMSFATGVRLPQAYSSPPPISNLSGLVTPGATGDEIAENLENPVTLEFPTRIGVLYYGFTPTLKAVDEQSAKDTVAGALKASGMVSDVVFIPSSLVAMGDSMENVRKLASRFGVDVLLFVDGSTNVALADSQDRGFFGSFGNAANYEARSTLTGLAMSVLTGRFLAPVQVVGHSGPTSLDPTALSYPSDSYALEKEAETQALLELGQQLQNALRALPGAPAAS